MKPSLSSTMNQTQKAEELILQQTNRKSHMIHSHKSHEFTDSNFHNEVLKHNDFVMVQFGSECSGNCQIMMPMIEELCTKFQDCIKFGTVDVENNDQIVETYGINELPTLLFFRDGEIIDHIVGPVPKDLLKTTLTGLLSGNNNV